MSWTPPTGTVDGLDSNTFDDVLARWILAEATADAAALDALLGADFRGDSPRGYVLTKDEWLDRYRKDGLTHDAFEWERSRVREHGDTVVAMGILRQAAAGGAAEWSGRYRATLVAVQADGRWSIVNLQLSPLPDASEPG